MELKQENFEQLVINSSVPVVVEFGAVWCGPCRLQKPILEAMKNESAGKYEVYMVDIDSEPYLSAMLNIASVPTTLIFKNGEETNRFVGYRNRASIEDYIHE